MNIRILLQRIYSEAYVVNGRLPTSASWVVENGDRPVENAQSVGVESHRGRLDITADVDRHASRAVERRRVLVDVRLQLEVVVDGGERRRSRQTAVHLVTSQL